MFVILPELFFRCNWKKSMDIFSPAIDGQIKNCRLLLIIEQRWAKKPSIEAVLFAGGEEKCCSFFLKKRIRIFCKERFLFSVTWLEKIGPSLIQFSHAKKIVLTEALPFICRNHHGFFFHRLWFPLENKFAGRRNYVFWFNEILKDMWNASYHTQPNRQETKGNTHRQKERHEKIKTEMTNDLHAIALFCTKRGYTQGSTSPENI